jgi:hypothetical protein
MPDARDCYPLEHKELDTLYRCKLCGALVRYLDRLLHSTYHEKLSQLITQPTLLDSDPPPF